MLYRKVIKVVCFYLSHWVLLNYVNKRRKIVVKFSAYYAKFTHLYQYLKDDLIVSIGLQVINQVLK